MTRRSKPCIYINTSIVIKAVNPREPGYREARRFLEECCRYCRCVYSSVHIEEIPDQYRDMVLGFLSKHASHEKVDTRRLRQTARNIIIEKGYSPAREIDLMHLQAARILGCKYLMARDRFIWRNAKYYALTYINWDTHRGKCPCSQSKNGAGSETKQANSYTRSPKSKRKTRQKQNKQKKSTDNGNKANSHTARQGKSSAYSQRKHNRIRSYMARRAKPKPRRAKRGG